MRQDEAIASTCFRCRQIFCTFVPWDCRYYNYQHSTQTYAFSIDVKINDLGWPWRAITHSVSKRVRLSEPITKIWMKIDYNVSDDDVAQWLYSGNIMFMRIFAVVLKICKFSWFYAYARILLIHVPHAFFVIKFNCYCLLQLSANGCIGKVKCGLAEMWVSKRISEMSLSSAEYLESAEKLRIFRRWYIIGILTNKANISI